MKENTLKINIEYESEKSSLLLDFINETRKGKFSEEKSIVETISFSRIEIEEHTQEVQEIPENFELTNILFGISD